MKIGALITFCLLATAGTAFAIPGGSNLICDTAANSTSKQKIHLEVHRVNSVGDLAPAIEFSLNNKKYPILTPNINKQYGETIHDAVLGVVVVTADTTSTNQKNKIRVQVMAIPGTVKAFNSNGTPAKWDLADEDGGECIDGYGKANFQGVFTGTLETAPSTDNSWVPLDNQIMDCTIDYNTGSAC